MKSTTPDTFGSLDCEKRKEKKKKPLVTQALVFLTMRDTFVVDVNILFLASFFLIYSFSFLLETP